MTVFLLALFILILIAFIKTRPPKGIKIKWGVTDLGILAQIVVENYTEYKLKDCCLQMNSAKGKIFSAPAPELPLNCKFFQNNEWVTDKLAEINHTKSKAFWLASPSNDDSGMGIFVAWNSQNSLKFKENTKAFYRFCGTLPNGKVLIKDFEITFNVNNKQIQIIKV